MPRCLVFRRKIFPGKNSYAIFVRKNMWKYINEKFFKIFWVSESIGLFITLIIFSPLLFIGIIFGARAVNLYLAILLGLIPLLLIYWIIRIIILIFKK